ncbi:MAG: hypothetical protein GQ574_20035 [Crocinitomix sp.]|nr:hypothetical protein [Crocinitomix sp.]
MNSVIQAKTTSKSLVTLIFSCLLMVACNSGDVDTSTSFPDDLFANIPKRDSVPNNYYLKGDTLNIFDLIDTSFIYFTNDDCHKSIHDDCIKKSAIKYVYDCYHWTTKLAEGIPFAIKNGRLFYERDSLIFHQIIDQISLPVDTGQSVTLNNVEMVFDLEECRDEGFLRFSRVSYISDSSLAFFENSYVEIDSALIIGKLYSGYLDYQSGDKWDYGRFIFIRNE